MANSNKLDKLWSLISEASKLNSKEKYAMALPLIQEATVFITTVEEAELTDWRNLFEVKYDALMALGYKEEMIQACHQMVGQFGGTKTWQGLSQAYAIRSVLRTAYCTVAQNCIEEATSLPMLQNAVDWIEKCFSHTARDEKNELKSFYEPRALIYRKAVQYEAQYEEKYLLALSDIVNYKIPVTDKDIEDDLQNLSFTQTQKNNPMNALLIGPFNETWKQAEKRWVKACKKLSDIDPEYIEAFASRVVTTKEDIAVAEALYFIPDGLKKMYRKAGNGFGNEFNGRGFRFYPLHQFMPLLDKLLAQWRDLPQPTVQDVVDWYVDNLKCFTKNEAVFINEHYRVFGSYWFRDEWPCYLFYGKNGKFGALIFNQDGWVLSHLADRNFFLLRYDTVDELMSRLVTVIISSQILDANSIYTEEAYALLDRASPGQLKEKEN